MKSLQEIILEKLKIRKSNKPSYKYFPKTKEELKDILKELIKERGNEGDFNDIDTSKITDMSELFDGIEEFNGNISNWDVSNCEFMNMMFKKSVFNQDISKWDVSRVKNFRGIFYDADFNQNIDNWKPQKSALRNDMFNKSPLQNNPPKWYKNY